MDAVYLDVAISDDWFCYRCGASGVYYIEEQDSEHTVVKFRYVIFPDVYTGPLYLDHAGKVTLEQCTKLETSESSGCQYILNLPKNWFPVVRYILDYEADHVLDANWNPVGSSGHYVDQLLGGLEYVPEGGS